MRSRSSLWTYLELSIQSDILMATCDVTAERRQDVMTSSVIRCRHYVRRQNVTADPAGGGAVSKVQGGQIGTL